MTCGICGKGCRKTTIVHVKSGSTLARKRAGQCCAGDAILLVMKSATLCKCGAPATQCHLCGSKKETAARKDGADVKAIVKRLKVMQLGQKSARDAEVQGSPEYCSYAGVIEGLESAIELLESGRW